MTWTKACSQPGMVCGATKTLLARVSGNSTTVPVLMTACGVRATRPRAAEDRLSAKASSRPIPARTPGARPAGRYPMAEHLVQAGLAEGELADHNALAGHPDSAAVIWPPDGTRASSVAGP